MTKILRTGLLAFALAVAAFTPAWAADDTHGTANAGDEHAAGEHHATFDPKTFGFQLLNFGVLLFILIKFGGGAANKAFKARHEQMKADMVEANKTRVAADERFKRQEQRLINLEQEIAQMRAAMKKDADNERAKIVASAEERARRIQDDTKFQLDQQVKEAELRFREQVATAALKVAETLLRQQVGPQDDQRLVQGFVNDLSARPAGAEAKPRTAPREEVVG